MRQQRRNITAGEPAMGYARLFPKAPTAQERGAMGGKGHKAVSPGNKLYRQNALIRPRGGAEGDFAAEAEFS
jgi:hypothetical protein